MKNSNIYFAFASFLFLPWIVSCAPTPTPQQIVDSQWVYEEHSDKLYSTVVASAVLSSDNRITVSSSGIETKMNLIISKNADPDLHNQDIVGLELPKGTFYCPFSKCKIMVSFDGGKPEEFHAISATGGSPKSIAFANGEAFLGYMRNAKKIVVDAPFAKAGGYAEFNVAGYILD